MPKEGRIVAITPGQWEDSSGKVKGYLDISVEGDQNRYRVFEDSVSYHKVASVGMGVMVKYETFKNGNFERLKWIHVPSPKGAPEAPHGHSPTTTTKAATTQGDSRDKAIRQGVIVKLANDHVRDGKSVSDACKVAVEVWDETERRLAAYDNSDESSPPPSV